MSIEDKESGAITNSDRDIASAESTLNYMKRQVNSLAQSIESHSKAASKAASENNRVVALRHLRSKKMQQEVMIKRSALLAQVEEARAKLEEAADHMEVLKAMKQTTSVLRMLHAESGGINEVESVVEGLDAAMTETKDISSVIEELPSHYSIDESEIDHELEELEAQIPTAQQESIATQETLQEPETRSIQLEGSSVPDKAMQDEHAVKGGSQRVEQPSPDDGVELSDRSQRTNDSFRNRMIPLS